MKWIRNGVFLLLSLLFVWQADLYDAWIGEVLKSILICSSVIASLIGWGFFITSTRRWDLLWMLGLGLLGTIALGVVLITQVQWLPMLLVIGWVQAFRNRHFLELPSLSNAHWIVCGLLFVFICWNSLLPDVDTDALYYHIALPKHMWMENTLLSGETHPNGSRPLIWHLVLTIVYGLANIQTVILFASIHALGAWVSIVEYLEEHNPNSGWMLWLILGTSYTILEQLTVVNNNMVVLWWCWLAFRSNTVKDKSGLGFLVGFAIAGKFTALAVAGLIGLTSTVRFKWKEALLAILLVGIWPLRNAIEGIPLLFPFSGWDVELPFLFVEKYGMGRDWWAMMTAPWNAIVHAKVHSVQFMGRLSAVFLLCGISIGWFYRDFKKHWRIWTILVGALAFWCMGPHWIRHLFPLMGVFLVLGIRHFPMKSVLAQVSLFVLTIGSISTNIEPFAKRMTQRWGGGITVPGDDAVQWINTQSPEGTVALLFLWQGANIDRPYILSSVEDHTPIRHWVLKYGNNSIQEMKNQGVKVVAVGPHTFHRHSLPFVSDDDFKKQWQEPVSLLESLLLKEARLITTQSGVDLYLLPQP